ncbi:MAG TPA: leucine--tRNA ligase [Patescibacteria group bacterium]|nr:leucine--tRNA ligase [Patescibacteria group bacterium]
MSNKYQSQQFEQKWIEKWEKEKVYRTKLKVKSQKSKVYCLPMFPYPSGAGLHVGHVRIYTGCDVLVRYFRMKGDMVLHPMGWDAFGLPAENAAIKAKKNPIDMVAVNIVNFKKQMQNLGFSYDWKKEFATSDPDYYKWTQWLFIQFFNKGLLYKKNTPINFCPVCKTGLAEEEVLSDGTHERCGNAITKKELPQWIFRITRYADRLLKDLDRLDWPKGILEMQKNWIGRKEGIEIKFKVKSQSYHGGTKVIPITVFTTTPVNFGATFLVVSPEHFLIKRIMEKEIRVSDKNFKEIKDYVFSALQKTEQERLSEGREKTGVDTGLKAINEVTGEEIPVWISDFVLSTVGTGAVQGCPGHDMRDFEFAQKYGLPITRVVVGEDGDTSKITRREQVIEKGMKGTMTNSDFLNGHDFAQAMQETMDYFEKKGWGDRVVTYHLRDWIFSRQRYWGEPIPMIFCQKCAKNQIKNACLVNRQEKFVPNELDTEIERSLCGWFPVLEDQLPVKLPYVKSYEPTETGESPLLKIAEFAETQCPHCGGAAFRETDTMPNWAGSCWYFIRFAQNKILKIKNKTFIDNWKLKIGNSFWLPVDWYLGGAEHAVLHLLYARFWAKAMYDIGLVNFEEPFLRLRSVGMVLAEDHRKMSKSWGNVINPDEVIAEYGADTLRIYEMFMAPFDAEISWSTDALQGAYRFLTRIWQIYHNSDSITEAVKNEDKKIAYELQKLISKVSYDIPNVKFNTAIAGMMGFLNKWQSKNKKLSKNNSKKFLQLLAPFAPFITEEIWRDVFGEKESIHLSHFPDVDMSFVTEEEIVIPVQVNGKFRGTVTISSKEPTQETVVKKALQNEKVRKYVQGKKYRVIYIKGKVLNLVL